MLTYPLRWAAFFFLISLICFLTVPEETNDKPYPKQFEGLFIALSVVNVFCMIAEAVLLFYSVFKYIKL